MPKWANGVWWSHGTDAILQKREDDALGGTKAARLRHYFRLHWPRTRQRKDIADDFECSIPLVAQTESQVRQERQRMGEQAY